MSSEETSIMGSGSSGNSTMGSDENPSIWGLVHGHLSNMINHAIDKASDQLTFREGLISDLRSRLSNLLNVSLKHVGYGSQRNRNDTVRHEVEVAVDEALTELNMTISNSSFSKTLAETLHEEIELDAFGQIVNTSSNTLDNTDFFHKMPMKDETLFVALVCMAVILPVIFATLLGIFFYKQRQENLERRQEMLLREQPEFSMSEYPAGSSSDRKEDLIPDLELKGGLHV